MTKTKTRKILMTFLKLGAAVVLLAYVVNQVHWQDYVTAADGKTTYALVSQSPAPDGTEQFTVSVGRYWNRSEQVLPAGQLKPITDKQGDPVLDPKTHKPKYDSPGFATSVKDLDLWLMLLAGAIMPFSIIIIAIRFWFLLRIQEIHITLWESVRLTFLGNFCNTFMPSTVGGDLIKAYYVMKHTPHKAAVFICIFVDRVLGLTELTLLAGVMISFVLATGLDTFDNVRSSVYTVLIVIAIVIWALTFLLSRRFRQLFGMQKLYQRLPIAHHIAAAGDAALLYRKRIGALGKAIAITVGSQVIWISSLAVIGLSLHLPVPFYSYFVYIPLIYIIGSIPISIGGVGLVEGLFLGFFATFNASPSSILAMALFARLVPLVWALPGAVVMVTGTRLPKAAAMEAELQAAENAELAKTEKPSDKPQ